MPENVTSQKGAAPRVSEQTNIEEFLRSINPALHTQSAAESLPAGELDPEGQSLHAEAPAAANLPAQGRPSEQ
jgi:hypothetical protein